MRLSTRPEVFVHKKKQGLEHVILIQTLRAVSEFPEISKTGAEKPDILRFPAVKPYLTAHLTHCRKLDILPDRNAVLS